MSGSRSGFATPRSRHRFGSQRRAYADRHGTRIVAVEADVPTRVEPGTATGVIYTVRAKLGVGWQSIEGRAGLLATYTHADIREEYTGTATVTLTSTPHDPLGDLPIHGILGAGARESRLTVTGQEIVAELPHAELVVVEHGGHVALLELADEVNDAIEQFLERLSA